MTQNKYIYLAVLQGNYGYGWDDLCQYDRHDPEQMAELKPDWRAYRENEPQYAHRIIHRRELNPNYKPKKRTYWYCSTDRMGQRTGGWGQIQLTDEERKNYRGFLYKDEYQAMSAALD